MFGSILVLAFVVPGLIIGVLRARRDFERDLRPSSWGQQEIQSGIAWYRSKHDGRCPERLDYENFIFPFLRRYHLPEDGVTGNHEVVSRYDGSGGWVYEAKDGKVYPNCAPRPRSYERFWILLPIVVIGYLGRRLRVNRSWARQMGAFAALVGATWVWAGSGPVHTMADAAKFFMEPINALYAMALIAGIFSILRKPWAYVILSAMCGLLVVPIMWHAFQGPWNPAKLFTIPFVAIFAAPAWSLYKENRRTAFPEAGS